MRKSFAISAATALILLFLLASFAASLENPFYVYGDVSDSTGAPVPAGVTVTVRDVTAGGEVIDQTDADGHYQIDVSPIPDSADGNSFTCSASYADETGSCSFTLDLTKPSQPCDIGLSEAAPLIAIKAGDGSDLPTSIPVDETFTVLITENGSSVGADTTVTFTLPYGTGDPVYCSTDVDGKVNYKPPITGTLGIRVLDGTDTVAEATVEVTTTGIQTLGSITISPDSPGTLTIGGSLTFTPVCRDTNSDVMTCPTLTWTSSIPAVGTITAGEFTAIAAGTTTITSSAGVTSNAVTVAVNAVSSDDQPVTGGNGSATSGDSRADVTLNDTGVNGTVKVDEISDPINDSLSSAGGNDTGLGLGPTANQLIKGAVVTVSDPVRDALLADVNDTSWVYIRLNYSQSVVDSLGINEGSIDIWKYNTFTNSWEKVKDQPYCIDSDRDTTDNYVWVKVTELSTFALVGTKSTPSRRGGGGGGGATYPPGWGTTPAVTATAAHGATPGATAAPPGKYVTPTPKKPVTAGTAATAAEGATAGAAAKKKTPGFEAVFAIAGLLAIAYVLMRRRD